MLANLRTPADRPREIRRAECAARPQRGAVLPRRHATTSTRSCRSSTRRRSGSPARNSATSSSGRAACSSRSRDRGQIADLLRNWPHPAKRDRRDRRRAHPRPRRSRRQRHGHPGRQAVALHGLRRRASRAVPAGHARRRHQQRGAAAATRSISACASGGSPARPTTSFVDEFMTAARKTFPGVLIQFEDFANHNAFRLLHKYRDAACVFNDDIQGTAAVALAGLFSALRVTGGKLRDQRILFLGAGEAATGIADLVVAAMMAEGAIARPRRGGAAGCSIPAASSSAAATDLAGHKLPLCARSARRSPISSTAIETLKPTAIIGVAAVGGAFTPRGARGDGRAQRAADRVRAVQPDLEGRVHGGGGLSLHRGPRAVRLRQSRSIRSRSTAGPSCRARATTPTSSPASASASIASRSRLVTDEMFMAAAHTLADCVGTEPTSTRAASIRRCRASARSRHASPPRSRRSPISAVWPTDLRPTTSMAQVQSQMYEPQLLDRPAPAGRSVSRAVPAAGGNAVVSPAPHDATLRSVTRILKP